MQYFFSSQTLLAGHLVRNVFHSSNLGSFPRENFVDVSLEKHEKVWKNESVNQTLVVVVVVVVILISLAPQKGR